MNSNYQKTVSVKEFLVARQTKYTTVKLNQCRTGKSKEYINTLLHRGFSHQKHKSPLFQENQIYYLK